MDLISVVVTTKNEEWCIERCLRSIQLQTWKNTEIIVVDNYSTDRTTEIANKYTSKVYVKGPERSAQRNYGLIDKACGRYAIYVDADMILSPTLLEECALKMADSNVVALYLPETVLGKSYWSSVRRFERSFYDATPIDGTRFFCREAIVMVGGFDEKLFLQGSGEDWDLDKKLKQVGKLDYLDCGRLRYDKDWYFTSYIKTNGVDVIVSEPRVYHDESKFDLIKYIRKKMYYSKGFDSYIKKWGKDDRDIKKQFGFYYRYLGVFVENNKWNRLIRNINLTFGMYALRVFIGFVYIYSIIKK